MSEERWAANCEDCGGDGFETSTVEAPTGEAVEIETTCETCNGSGRTRPQEEVGGRWTGKTPKEVIEILEERLGQRDRERNELASRLSSLQAAIEAEVERLRDKSERALSVATHDAASEYIEANWLGKSDGYVYAANRLQALLHTEEE